MNPEKAKKLLNEKKAERDRLLGRLDSLKEELSEYGFENLDDIDDTIDKFDLEIEEKTKEYKKKLASWKKKYANFLDS